MISSGASHKVFVLAFDYRGFGQSSGSPTEKRLTEDAIAVIKWAMDTAKVDPRRIVLVAQSLGTALASAAARYFIHASPKVEFGGIVLCAAFMNAATVFLNYSAWGRLPLLAPVKYSRTLKLWFERRVTDSWATSKHIDDLVKGSDKLSLVFVHAKSDEVIPWRQTEELFYVAASATSQEGLTRDEVNSKTEVADLGEGGRLLSWRAGTKYIRANILHYGGKQPKRTFHDI